MKTLIEWVKSSERTKDSPDWALLNHDSHEHMEKHYASIRKHHGADVEKRHREQDARYAQHHRDKHIQKEPTHKLTSTVVQNGKKIEAGTHVRHNIDKKTMYSVKSGKHAGSSIKLHPHQVEKI